MNEYLLDPNVCPSSLGEDDLPIDPEQTAHKWDETTGPMTCAECGAELEMTKEKAREIALMVLNDFLETHEDTANVPPSNIEIVAAFKFLGVE